MKYEIIIVGAGAGGGVVAGILAEAGKRVLLLERGHNETFAEIGRDHLRNQRLSLYGHNAGPSDDHPRVAVDERGEAYKVLPWQPAYQANAAIVGGGTRVYGGLAWRFHPLDFKMGSTYGAPEGSSLADWPITYEDLAPYYERVEHELGVCGDGAAMTHLPPYRRDYPMPPQPLNRIGAILRRGGARLAHLAGAARYQQRAVSWPACVHPLPALRRLRLPGRGEERHAQHVHPTRAEHRSLRSDHRRDGRAHRDER